MKEKRPLSANKWLCLFLATLLFTALLVPAFNFIVDPYGAFGDRFFQWWSYDETLNPRMAKISYLEQHSDQYDSFIVGSSGSSSIPVETLNRCLDASFFNCMFYGSDAASFESMALYLLDRYQPKNLLLNLSMNAAMSPGETEDKLTKHAHWRVSGENPLQFYLKYGFASPLDSVKKLQLRASDGYLQDTYKVFNEQTGAYDKSKRDAEPIGDLDAYLAKDAYKVFQNYPKHSYQLSRIEECAASVQRIKDRCAETGTRLLVTCQPTYIDNLAYFSQWDQAAFFNALANVTDYWDFTCSSVSFEPRYFYDATHARNAVGEMELARIFGDESVYIPADFGRYVAQGDIPGVQTAQALSAADYTAKLPILRYHHLIESGDCNSVTITVGRFAEQMAALHDAGYTPVSIAQVRAYVEQGEPLPEKPVMITFDDGYESNYALAYPILKEYGFSATIFAIGVSIGKDTYKDTGVAMTPHFTMEQAAEMEASGLITVASHGYNVHEAEGRDPEPLRQGVLQREGESEADYVAFLTQDAQHMFEILGDDAGFFAYPKGLRDERARVILRNAGVWATVLAEGTTANVLIKGLPQCLYDMLRLYVGEETTGEALIEMLDQS